MLKKIFKKIKNDIKENYKIYIFYIIILCISIIPLNYYIFSPGELIDLTDRIHVENNYSFEGSFNLTYVTTRKATILTYLLSYVIPSWDLEKLETRQIDNESMDDIETRGQVYLKETSYDAIIAAFTEAGKEYKIKSNDVAVTHVFEYADTNIEVGDTIKTVNDKSVSSVAEISEILKDLKENDEIKIKVERNNKIVECYARIKIISKRNVIGIIIANLKEVETSPKIEYIFKDNESGSSRGLMCALDIYNKITENDLTHGDIISGTGTIDDKGNVGAIDGVKYKLTGAYEEGAKVFIVPSDNYEEALKLKEENKYDIELIEAKTLHEVIERLNNR